MVKILPIVYLPTLSLSAISSTEKFAPHTQFQHTSSIIPRVRAIFLTFFVVKPSRPLLNPANRSKHNGVRDTSI